MAAIPTWRNVEGANLGAPGALLQTAGGFLNQGLKGLQDTIATAWAADEARKTKAEEELVSQFKSGMSANLDPNAVRSGIESGAYRDSIEAMGIDRKRKDALIASLMPTLQNAETYQSNKLKSAQEAEAQALAEQNKSMLPAVRTLEAAALSSNPAARQEALTAIQALASEGKLTDPTAAIKSITGLADWSQKQADEQSTRATADLVNNLVQKTKGMTKPVRDREARMSIETPVSDSEKYDFAKRQILETVAPKDQAKALAQLDAQALLLSTATPELFGADLQAQRKAESDNQKALDTAARTSEIIQQQGKFELGRNDLTGTTLGDREGLTAVNELLKQRGIAIDSPDPFVGTSLRDIYENLAGGVLSNSKYKNVDVNIIAKFLDEAIAENAGSFISEDDMPNKLLQKSLDKYLDTAEYRSHLSKVQDFKKKREAALEEQFKTQLAIPRYTPTKAK